MSWTAILQFFVGVLGFATALVGPIVWLYQKRVKELKQDKDQLELDKEKLQGKLRLAKQESAMLRTGTEPQLRLAQERISALEEQIQEDNEARQKLQARAANAEAERIRLREVLQKAKDAWAQLQDQKGAARQDASELRTQLQRQLEIAEEMEKKIECLMEERNDSEAKLEVASRSLQEVEQQVYELKQQLDMAVQQIQSAAEQNGRVWEKALGSRTPAFVPLAARAMPIISVINLKGGVGKTTLTANLAAMLGQQGQRVLVIDLDYQRSLSLLCCNYDLLHQLHQGQRCLQHFLLHPQPDASRLLECMVPMKRAERCEIVATSEMLEGVETADSLEDAEMRLMAAWLVGGSIADVRFHLRHALHAARIRERFDVVLLDCPPRLSTACINALAASDFALIPVLLDLTSAISVPNLLRKLRRLATVGVLDQLEVLGVVANRVKLWRGDMVKDQATVWQEIRPLCQRAWEKPVPFFDSFIKESGDVSRAADRHDRDMKSGTFAAFLSDLEPVFADMVGEVTKRIGRERKRLEAVPA